MKNYVKVASLLATLALAACQTNPSTAISPKADPVNSRNVQDGPDAQIWVSGEYGATDRTQDALCWQTGYPDGASIAGCGGAVAPAKTQPPAAGCKINLASSTLFAFDKAVLSGQGSGVIADVASKVKGCAGTAVTVTGHTDSWGSTAYNNGLSMRRAAAVKAGLVANGIPAGSITTAGKGESELVVQPSSCTGSKKARQDCEAPNRRVTVEVN